MKQSKPRAKKEKITIKAKHPKRIKTAIRSWVKASGMMDCDPFDLNDAPAWAEKALAEVVKVILPGKRLPTSGEWSLELLGEFFGRLQAFPKLYAGEIPMGPGVQADWYRLEKQAASIPQSPERTAKEKVLMQDFQNRFEVTSQAIPQLMDSVLGSSHEDALAFQKGLMRGMSIEPDELTTAKTFQRHTRTFWVLGIGWRRFSKCRSVGEVHRQLCAAFGEDKIGSLKTFENRIANKIGMRFGPSGRPPKIK